MIFARHLRILRHRVRAVWRPGSVDAELANELRLHLDQLAAENVAKGMDVEEARFAARRTLGNLPLVEEQCRETRRVAWLHDAWQDLRYACRQCLREKRPTAVVVLTLALGVGANTGLFSIVDGFRRPLPVDDPEQLVVLAAEVRGDEQGARYRHSHAALQDLRRAGGDRFASLFGFSLQITGITLGDKPSRFLYALVTGNYFSGLGVEPAVGRLFVPGEGEAPGDDSVLVLGYSFWQQRFGGDPNVVGTEVRVGGSAARIIGVVPRQFRGTYAAIEVDGYLPLNAVRADPTARRLMFSDRTARWITVIGRLKPGVGLKDAQASMSLAAQQLERQHPESDRGIGVRVVPETRARPDPVGLLGRAGASDRGAELLLLCLAGLVLLVACLNVGNLLLVRATARAREMAVRAALGSSRGRLIRQVLAETALLAVAGAAIGLVLGQIASRAFERTLDGTISFPMALDFSFDWRVFLYGMAAASVSASVIGIWPAVRASRANATEALHEGSRGDSGGPKRHRLRSLFAGGQIAGSLVLLVVAALFVRDLRNATRLDLGFTPDNLLNFHMDPDWAGYDAPATDSFYRQLQEKVRTLPGVRSVALAHSVPMGYYWDSAVVEPIGRPANPDEQPPIVPLNYVGPEYFGTMEIAIVRGRSFETADAERGSPIAIVNETMAERFWPNQDPIGGRFRMRAPDWVNVEVVGVARDSKYINLLESQQPYLYLPLGQYPKSMRVLHVRSSTPPELLSPRIEQTIAALGPDVPVSDVQTMRASLEGFGGFMLLRIGATQAAAIGGLGLLLAAIGVYGVASYATAQRTREIGIRMALGAGARDVLRLVLGQGTLTIACGVVAGLLGATAMATVLTRVLGMEDATDSRVFGGAAIVLGTIALAACYLPARRALQVTPSTALRQE